MSTQTFQVTAGGVATLLVASGTGPHLILNQDPSNTLYVGDTNSIKSTDTSVIALGPNQSVAVDGQSNVFGTTTVSAPISVAVLQGGTSFFQPPTRITILAGPGGGLFVYSGAAQLGSLIETTGIPTQGTDSFGNFYLQGDTTYFGGVPGVSHATVAIEMFGAGVAWLTYNFGLRTWIPAWEQSMTPNGTLQFISLGNTTAQIIGNPSGHTNPQLQIGPNLVIIGPSTDTTGATDLPIINNYLSNGIDIWLTSGEFYVNGPIKIPPNRSIRGAGDSGLGLLSETTIRATAAMPAVIYSVGWDTGANTVAQQNIKIRDLKLYCNGLTTYGIVTQNYDSKFENLHIQGSTADALLQDSFDQSGVVHIGNTGVNNRILDCTAEGCGQGFTSNEASSGTAVFTDGFIENCTVTSTTGAYGIGIQRMAGWTVDNNHLYGLAQHGILAAQMFASSITNNYIETWGNTGTSGFWRAIDGSSIGQSDGGPGSVISHNRLMMFNAPGNAASNIRGISITCDANNSANFAVEGNVAHCGPAAGFANATAFAYANAAATSNLTIASTGNLVTGHWTAGIVQTPNGGVITVNTGV